MADLGDEDRGLIERGWIEFRDCFSDVSFRREAYVEAVLAHARAIAKNEDGTLLTDVLRSMRLAEAGLAAACDTGAPGAWATLCEHLATEFAASGLACDCRGVECVTPRQAAHDAVAAMIVRGIERGYPVFSDHDMRQSLLGFGRRVANNEARRRLRAGQRRGSQDLPRRALEKANFPSPWRRVDDRERISKLASVIDGVLSRLTRRQRDALSLHYGAGLTQAQIAGQLGVSQPAITGYLSRARRTLAEALGARGLSPSGEDARWTLGRFAEVIVARLRILAPEPWQAPASSVLPPGDIWHGIHVLRYLYGLAQEIGARMEGNETRRDASVREFVSALLIEIDDGPRGMYAHGVVCDRARRRLRRRIAGRLRRDEPAQPQPLVVAAAKEAVVLSERAVCRAIPPMPNHELEVLHGVYCIDPHEKPNGDRDVALAFAVPAGRRIARQFELVASEGTHEACGSVLRAIGAAIPRTVRHACERCATV